MLSKILIQMFTTWKYVRCVHKNRDTVDTAMHTQIYVKGTHLVVQVCPCVDSGSLCYDG
jgi:deoxycytidylate deaminase